MVALCYISAKSGSTRGASGYPAFVGNCNTGDLSTLSRSSPVFTGLIERNEDAG